MRTVRLGGARGEAPSRRKGAGGGGARTDYCQVFLGVLDNPTGDYNVYILFV